MSMTTWFSQIDRARSVTELLSLTRDYIATWSPEELALLPPECRPGRIRDAQDIEDLHGTLVDVYRVTRVTGEALEALQRLTSFFVRLSIRLSEIAGRAGDASGGTGGGPSLGAGKSAESPGH